MTESYFGTPTVLLRCDATSAGGVGHLARCLALAQALRRAGAKEIHISGEVSAPLGRAMLSAIPVARHESLRNSASLLDLASRIGASVVHVDHYGGFDDLRELGRRRGIVTSTATDQRFGRRDADVIVNGSPRAAIEFDELYGGASVGLGPMYLPLREEIAATTRVPARRGELGVLIVIGGTDAAGYGPSIVRAVSGLPGVSRIGLVGADAPSLSQEAGGARVKSVPRQADFVALIAGWDIVITGAGTTVWELAALGVPMAIVGVAENQRDHYDTLTSRGLAVGLGFLPDPSDIDTRALISLLGDEVLRRRMVEDARMLVDGGGAARIVQLWRTTLSDLAVTAFTLREASPGDVGRLFAWRQDPAARSASRSTVPLVWSQHVEWFGTTLARPDRRLFVGFSEGHAVGTVRFDMLSNHEWEVSVTVAPDERGRGWATRLVAVATGRLRAIDDESRVFAVLRATNAASRAVFVGLGYQLASADGEWERWTNAPASFKADPS